MVNPQEIKSYRSSPLTLSEPSAVARPLSGCSEISDGAKQIGLMMWISSHSNPKLPPLPQISRALFCACTMPQGRQRPSFDTALWRLILSLLEIADFKRIPTMFLLTGFSSSWKLLLLTFLRADRPNKPSRVVKTVSKHYSKRLRLE